MLKKRIRDSKIPLRIFEVNRIDFVRHCGRADFASFRFLGNPTVAYVSPDVLRKSYENRIDTAKIIKKFGVGIMRLYLRSSFIQFQFDSRLCIKSLYKSFAEFLPAHTRSGNNMRVVIPSSTSEFDQNAPVL